MPAGEDGRGSTAVSPLLDAVACVWICVPDVDSAAELLSAAAGVQQLREGQLRDGRLESTWVPAGALAGSPRWLLLGDPGLDHGAVCLLQGPARTRTGGLPRGWDGVELVVRDVDAAADVLNRAPGVHHVWGPVDTDLSQLGSNVHRTGVWRAPWGTHLLLTTGITQAQERDFPSAPSGVGRVFEVHLRTDRFTEARQWYRTTLAMPALLQMDGTRGPIHDAWGVPAGTPISMCLLKTGDLGTGHGAVELQGHAPAVLDDEDSDNAGGTVLVSFTTRDLDACAAALRRDGVQLAADPAVIADGPFAGSRGLLVRGVEGEHLQLVQREHARPWPV